MAVEALAQVRDSLDALIKGDADLARRVIQGDRRIDRHQRLVRKGLKEAIRRDPDRLNTWLRLINTARNLERVADHATNIAEAVIYLKEGDIVRHSPRTKPGGCAAAERELRGETRWPIASSRGAGRRSPAGAPSSRDAASGSRCSTSRHPPVTLDRVLAPLLDEAEALSRATPRGDRAGPARRLGRCGRRQVPPPGVRIITRACWSPWSA